MQSGEISYIMHTDKTCKEGEAMKKIISLILAINLCLLLCGCGKEPELVIETVPQSEAVSDRPAESAEPQTENEAGFSFEDVSGLDFYFSAGAGGWCTVMNIASDGSFKGNYHDSDMGSTGDEYPNGTLHVCDFKGKFTEPKKLDEHTYTFKIESMEYEKEFSSEIIDDVNYCYTDAYGLTEATDFYMYLPGAELPALPEEYRSLVGYGNLEMAEESTLPFYGLYDVNAQCGFSSHETFVPSAQYEAAQRLAEAAEKQELNINEKMKSDITQTDMNIRADEMYKCWDDCLNSIWKILEESLEKSDMDQLRKEEMDWIKEKEAAAEQAGKEVEGGSMYPLVTSSKVAELTKNRIYELMEYLR